MESEISQESRKGRKMDDIGGINFSDDAEEEDEEAEEEGASEENEEDSEARLNSFLHSLSRLESLVFSERRDSTVCFPGCKLAFGLNQDH
jgi:hypothetical protein